MKANKAEIKLTTNERSLGRYSIENPDNMREVGGAFAANIIVLPSGLSGLCDRSYAKVGHSVLNLLEHGGACPSYWYELAHRSEAARQAMDLLSADVSSLYFCVTQASPLVVAASLPAVDDFAAVAKLADRALVGNRCITWNGPLPSDVRCREAMATQLGHLVVDILKSADAGVFEPGVLIWAPKLG